MIDRPALAEFLRSRRQALQPADVGLPRGARRRTSGLRREEIAALSDMSSDYYARLERGAGPQPSAQMVAAIARGLRLSLAERDHLFRLAGHAVPARDRVSDHVSPGMMRVLDRMSDTPAQVMGSLGETLAQTPPAIALLGEQTRLRGPWRSAVYRWFTDPSSRQIYFADDHAWHARTMTAQLRRSATEAGPLSAAAALARRLRQESGEFAALWADHEIGLTYSDVKRFVHPEIGRLDLHCQTLLDPDQQQSLLVFTATPGTQSAEKLQLLAILGDQQLAVSASGGDRRSSR
ncbi:MAG: helix-turn-helix transcriptional regulator [Actinomycetota bacterium]|nr:helix-turn-helix transcriptional regulator [Actinomycetota bacterium]MDQ6938517.1 helix-turn-helix transcriptional regulator [Actinomycetota bacterium]